MTTRRVTGLGLLALLLLPAPGRCPPTPEESRAPADLLKARLATARDALRMAETLYAQGDSEAEVVHRWSCRVLEAEKALGEKPADRAAAAQAHRDRMKNLQERAQKLSRAGLVKPLEPWAAAY